MNKALYVHVPFCQHICAYCDFMRCGYQTQLADQWLRSLRQELAQKGCWQAKTIYIGGGTPSALSLDQLRKLLHLLAPYANQVREYTIEANPDSFTKDKIELCRSFGVNRVSLGVQSFHDELLQYMDRPGNRMTTLSCIHALQEAGIKQISVDLLYGLQKQNMTLWEQDLYQACALPIHHLSLYALSIEPHSYFGRTHVEPCDADLESDYYERALTICKENGFEHYEISSFARDQAYSAHNLAYWHYDDFCGVGCGASGKEDHFRYDNTRNLHTYLTQGAQPERIKLSKADEMFEMMMMGLRIRWGVDDALFYERFQCSYDDVFHDAIQKHIKQEYLTRNGRFLRTTKKGMLLLHDILVDFL